jgi:hypothetical protein
MSNTIIEKMEKHVKAQREALKVDNNDAVKPGQPVSFTEASTPGDAYWQGDLLIIDRNDLAMENGTFPGFSEATRKKDESEGAFNMRLTKLVLGETQGARHTLRSTEGVKVFHPENWNDESLVGPILVLDKNGNGATIDHPVHGSVSIPAGFTVALTYQREWDKYQAQQRRARD